jgi:hypothetical protein
LKGVIKKGKKMLKEALQDPRFQIFDAKGGSTLSMVQDPRIRQDGYWKTCLCCGSVENITKAHILTAREELKSDYKQWI